MPPERPLEPTAIWDLDEFPLQPYKPIDRISPMGPDLERLNQPPKTPLTVPVEWAPERPRSRGSLGAGSSSRSSPTGLKRLMGELFYS